MRAALRWLAVAGAVAGGDDVAGEDVGAVRTYLRAVYPAGRASIDAASDARVVALYESLDYFYDCGEARLGALSPRGACGPVAGLPAPPRPPYLPPGAYFSAADATTDELSAEVKAAGLARGSFTRWRVLGVRLAARARVPESLRAAVGARLGPAPSWTSPAAIARYALDPLGLDGGRGFARPEDPRRGRFAVGNASRFDGLKRGDAVEVEQCGGAAWAESGFPHARGGVFGLFANAWRGTGVFLRVGEPFVSKSKATAVVGMLRAVGARDGGDDRLHRVAALLGLRDAALRDVARRYPDAALADAVAALLFAGEPPCRSVGGYRHVKGVWNAWRSRVWGADGNLAAHPRRVADDVADARSLGLHWFAGVCSVGPRSDGNGCRDVRRYRRGDCPHAWAAWDGLLMVLACLLGVKTLVLSASANDNGLFHEEVVDYDAPGGWRERSEGLNSPKCLAPFDDGFGAPRRRDVRRHYASTGKFVLKDPLGGATAPCDAVPLPRRADAGLAARPGSAWNATGATPRGCYAACRGALSEAHATIAVDQVAPGHHGPPGWAFGDAPAWD